MRLLIEVHTHNRKAITEIVLNQIKKYKGDADLRIVNDNSTEYDTDWLKQFSDDIVDHKENQGISKLKYNTFKYFNDSDYTHLYMCDNDIFHDPKFVDVLKKYHKNNLPMTLYRSSFIHSFGDRVSKYIKVSKDVSIKKGLYGGASVFLNKEHVSKICMDLPQTSEQWEQMCSKIAWDSKIQNIIDPKRIYLITNKSYCEHFGVDGLNHKEKDSDFALNPTDYIKEKSEEIWKKIM